MNAQEGRSCIGAQGERIAADFLKRLGYEILQRNYRARAGEIDLIARDGDEVVFVEVKTRASSAWGEPEDAVTAGKRRKLWLAAREYVASKRIDTHPLRFDVVSVILSESSGPQVRHFKDAFVPSPLAH